MPVETSLPLLSVSVGSAPRQNEMAVRPTAPCARQAANVDELMSAQEQTPAYRALYENGLMCNQYRIRRVEDLDLVKGDQWSITQSLVLKCATCHGCCCCMIQFFVVSQGCVRKGTHQDGKYLFFGPGVHVHPSPYVSVETRDIRLTQGAITHGTRAIVTVTQGFIGLAMDRGQPMLLPPGLHQWDSPTIEFLELIDLSSSLIRMGPYTLVTVDEGYAAVTQDNGEQKILEGGKSYMLTHRNWKFEKFMTKKLQTNDVGPISVTTGDRVPLMVTANVNWLIEDAKLAARMAATTMTNPSANQQRRYQNAAINEASQGADEFDITSLRQDVVRQVTSSLAAFIGSVSYSDHGGHAGMAACVEGKRPDVQSALADPISSSSAETDPEEKERKALFDPARLNNSVDHANEICERYGVKILSINLISASPADRGLLDALSQGAVATVAAQQTETAARGQANAMLLQARAEAEAARIRAEGDAKAEVLRAEGSLEAASKLQTSQVAVDLARMKTAGNCLKDTKANTFFFGLQGATDIPSGVLGTALLAEAFAAKK